MQALLQQIIIKTEIHFFSEIFKNMIEIKASADTMLACPLMDIIYLIHFSI